MPDPLRLRPTATRLRAQAAHAAPAAHAPAAPAVGAPVNGAIDDTPIDWAKVCFAIDPKDMLRLKLLVRTKGFRTRADALRWVVNAGLTASGV